MHTSDEDSVHIEQLELFARIGVTDLEREQPQRLTASITIWPKVRFDFLHDDITQTTDYAELCSAVRDFAAARKDKLIETLAAALAEHLLQVFPIQQVQIELRKFVLADAQYAAARLTRRASVG